MYTPFLSLAVFMFLCINICFLILKVIEGKWKNDRLSDDARIIFANGSKYEGDFKENRSFLFLLTPPNSS